MGKNLIRIGIALVIVIFGVVKFCSSADENPVTGETQYVNLTAEQEMALGEQSIPEMVKQFGGLHPSSQDQDRVKTVGKKLVANSFAEESPYDFNFFLLADPNTVNAFALPGGPVFITDALYSQLENEDQLAGVLSHEIVHVIGRHSAERIAKQEFSNSVITAVAVGAESAGAAQSAAVIGNLVNMNYGRNDELESDQLGVRIMVESGYDPNALIGVMEILEKASGGGKQPEFFSTHPSTSNRKEEIRKAIDKYQ